MLNDVLIPLLTHPVAETREGASRLVRLASSFATHATLRPLEVDVPPLRNRWSSALLGLDSVAAEIERASRQTSQALQTLAGESFGIQLAARSLRVPFGDPSGPLSLAARCHDLTMVLFSDPEPAAALAEAAMFGTGRPAMLIPAGIPEPDGAFARIAIAWDGSGTASRALYDAMPLLTKADEVLVVSAPADKPVGEIDLDDVSGYLVRHGVAARLVEAKVEGQDVGLALQHSARAEGAGLLVMGAYGHNRVQQFILGGATRSVLSNLQLPVLMSHS